MENRNKESTFSMAGVVCSLLFLAGSFLPIITVFGESFSLVSSGKLTDGPTDAIIFIPLAVLMLIAFLMRKFIPAAVLSVLALIFSVMKQMDFAQSLRGVGGMAQLGIAAHVFVGASIGALACAVLGYIARRKTVETHIN